LLVVCVVALEHSCPRSPAAQCGVRLRGWLSSLLPSLCCMLMCCVFVGFSSFGSFDTDYMSAWGEAQSCQSCAENQTPAFTLPDWRNPGNHNRCMRYSLAQSQPVHEILIGTITTGAQAWQRDDFLTLSVLLAVQLDCDDSIGLHETNGNRKIESLVQALPVEHKPGKPGKSVAQITGPSVCKYPRGKSARGCELFRLLIS
jgi:hypothetical protein